MNYVLTVFVDALKPESLKHMPFVQSFTEKRSIKAQLGYSNTCHASMYSGVYPNKHLHWFIWQYSPNTSPFKWINDLKIHKLPHNIYTKYLCYRVSCCCRKEITAFFGIPFLWNMPLKCWHYFDVSEKKFWTEPGFLDNYPTIFDILREHSIDFDVVGMPRTSEDSARISKNHFKAIKEYNPDKMKPWTYFFVGDIDPLSHYFGQDSSKVQMALRELDKALEQKCNLFKERVGNFTFILFSDHGQQRVKEDINLYSLFESSGRNLEDYIFFIDSNYARFWFRTQKEEIEIREILSKLSEKGFILTEELFRKYKTDMPDNRYGDLIFYLDAPYMFGKGEISVMGKKRNPSYVSMHGYLPENQESDGVFVSNRAVIDQSHVRLVDITPSILSLLNAPIPKHMDGMAIWK